MNGPIIRSITSTGAEATIGLMNLAYNLLHKLQIA